MALFLACSFFIGLHNQQNFSGADKFFNIDPHSSFFFEYSMRHPFQKIFVRQLLRFVHLFFPSEYFSIVFTQSICGSSIVVILYKILSIWTNNTKLAVLMSIIYGISFSTLMFTSIPEQNYIFAALSNSLLFLYLSLLAKRNTKLNLYDYINISVLTFISFGIIFISFISNFILILWLLYYKNRAKTKKIIKDFTIILAIIALLLFVCTKLQQLQNVSFEPNAFLANCIDFSFHYNKVKILFYSLLVESLYALKINTTEKGYFYFAEQQSFISLIPSILLWIFAALNYTYKTKIEKNENYDSLIFTLILIAIVNLFECFIWATSECFLFSQNILIYLIVLLGLMFNKVLNKFVNIFLLLFIIYQSIINSIAIMTITENFRVYFEYLMYPFGMVLFLVLGWIILKKIINKYFSLIPIEQKFNIIINIFLFVTIGYSISLAIFTGG